MAPLYALLGLLLFCSHAPCPPAAANDTLEAGRALAAGDKLVSRNGKFALGFFQPASTIVTKSGNATSRRSSAWYVGIWFNKIPVFTAVWVANREKPIADAKLNLTELRISSNGGLIASHAGTEPAVWSTPTVARSTNATIAVLLNSGNLLLTENPPSSGGGVLWQSFDHPTDAMLPGAKFSRNKLTGLSSQAVSSKSLIDPGLGSYAIKLDTTGVVLKRRSPSIVYWSWASGPSSLKLMPILRSILELDPKTRGLINASYVDDDQEEYYTYTAPEESPPTFISLGISGHITLNLWSQDERSWRTYTQPAAICTPSAACGPFTVCDGNARSSPCSCMESFSQKSPPEWEVGDRTGGCVRNTPLRCSTTASSANADVFHPIARVTLPYSPRSIDAAATQSECEEACLSSCSCTAYSYSGGSRCSVWHGELLSVNLNDGIDNSSEDVLYLRLAAMDSPTLQRRRRRTGAGAAAAAAAIVASGSLMLILSFAIWRNRSRCSACSSLHQNHGGSGITAFRYSELVRATKNFSEKLGAGGFGAVYKGVLSDSATAVAVKRLDGARQGEKQFRAEVSSIGLIQHINLVRLIGFCCDGDHRLLVYEHMTNGSLEGHLFKNSEAAAALSWSTRYEIALGVARGLSYLHRSCRECIIHCDVKPENVLLDASFAPKVADFGMAAFVGRDRSRILTTFRGTAGYLAPEWLTGVPVTPKIDVYGFGMVLMEIVSGRRNSPESRACGGGGSGGSSCYDEEYFPVQAISGLHGGDVGSLMDPKLQGDFDLEQAERLCRAASWCIQDDEFDRPTMGEVVRILEGLQEIEVPPMPRLLAAMAERSGATSVG